MKKKIVVSLLICTLALSGCGGSGALADTSDVSSETSTEGDALDLDAIGDIEVDENLLTMEFTVPADYVDGTSQEELDAFAEEHGYKSVTLNEDGSATYVMTKGQHKEMMDEMAESINTDLAKMIGSEDYPTITDITANDDFTEFTITTTSTELGLNESLAVIIFYMYGGMYNVFNGTPVDNVHVDFVNADSGEIIGSSDSSETESTQQPAE